ncbi:MAG: HAD family hydrolase [Suipraeoptans sp.]
MKAVIFDMDGVMFDTETADRAAWFKVGKEHNISGMKEFTESIVGINGKYLLAKAIKLMGSEKKAKELLKWQDEAMDIYYSTHEVDVKLGLYELLDYLKQSGYAMAIASSGSTDWIMKNVIGAGVKEYFDVIISGDMVEKSKPDPEIYLKTCRELSISPKEAWVIEDSKNGINAAVAAGCKTLFVPDLWEPDNVEELSGIYGKYKDLLEVIQELGLLH